MKRLLTLLLLMLGGYSLSVAQNLVPNPSFETISSCPPGNSGLGNGFAPPWVKPPGALTTPDLFHSCGSAGTGCGNINVPNNFAGISNAFHGVAYSGVITYYTSCPNCREYVQVQLTSALIAGNAYEVRFRTKLGSRCRYGTDRIGLHLSNTAPSQPSNQPIGIAPTYEHPGTVTDKTNWTLVKTTYIASGGERYITLGNFRNNAATSIFNFGSSSGSCLLATAGATYYFDSVFVGLQVVLDGGIPDFTAKRQGEDVQLSWEIEAEDGDYMTLEHARTGSAFEPVWMGGYAAGKEAPEGFLHQNPGPGRHFYRMTHHRFDGEAVHSDIVEALMPEDGYLSDGLLLMPNPASDEVRLVWADGLEINAEQRWELMDLMGRVIRKGRPGEVPGQELRISLDGIAPGTYLLQLKGAGRNGLARLVVNK